MYFNKLKRWGAVLMAGVMVLSLAGCGKKDQEQNGAKEPSEKTTTESASGTDGDDHPEYVEDDVELPDDFGDMIYPLEALMVEASSKGLPYYSEESSEEEADSFWFSMAVLTSLMNDYVKDVTVDTDDEYLYLSEDTVDMYASALYHAYAQGNLEFPELTEDNTYATYREDDNTYGFLSGDVGLMEARITDCEKDGEDYLLTAELVDEESDEPYGKYEITITPNLYEGEDNAFAYAVSSFEEVESDDWKEDAPEAASTEDREEDTEEMEDTEETEATTEGEDDDEDEAASISQDDALELAKDYYGEEAEYTYKGTVTVGDYEYYDFGVKGDNVSSTDVLVSANGQDVIGGIQNDDGSWSFDQ